MTDTLKFEVVLEMIHTKTHETREEKPALVSWSDSDEGNEGILHPLSSNIAKLLLVTPCMH